MNVYQHTIDKLETFLIHADASDYKIDAARIGRLTLIEIGQLTRPVNEVVDHPNAVAWWGFSMEQGFCPCKGIKI